METSDVRSSPRREEDLPDTESSENSCFIRDVHNTRNSTNKRQRTSEDTVHTHLTNASRSYAERGNAIVRMILRSCMYFVYDGVSAAGGHKEFARIGKAIVEFFVDESFPPPHRSDMSIGRKCTEYLVAPAASSLVWFIVSMLKASRRKRLHGERVNSAFSVWGKALWEVSHRIARQALIYRLFFRIGSLRYTFASLLGIVCCFFKDSLFPDFLQLRKWPSHFSPSQGLAALFRSVVYALSFSLPVQNLSKVLHDSARRRGNVKKLIFAVILSQLQCLREIAKLVSTSQSWTL